MSLYLHFHEEQQVLHYLLNNTCLIESVGTIFPQNFKMTRFVFIETNFESLKFVIQNFRCCLALPVLIFYNKIVILLENKGVLFFLHQEHFSYRQKLKIKKCNSENIFCPRLGTVARVIA